MKFFSLASPPAGAPMCPIVRQKWESLPDLGFRTRAPPCPTGSTAMSMQIASASHTGNLRKRNEDRLFVSSLADGGLLLAVADGMGGAPQGEKAASIAVECLHEMQNLAAPPQQKLKALILKAHDAILRYGRSHSGNDGMGTTMTLCPCT